jgi:hypothetical protein
VFEKERYPPELPVVECFAKSRHAGKTDAVIDLPVRNAFGIVFDAVFRELRRMLIEPARNV